MSYYVVDTSDELYHHGVKGMKWGVRRARRLSNMARMNASAANSSRSPRFIRRMNNQNALYYGTKADRANNFNNAKGVRGKLDALYGNKAAASQNQQISDFYKREAGIARTRFGKKRAEIASYNSQQRANMYANRAKGYIGKMKQEWNLPQKSITGKDTTFGKEYVKGALIGLGATVAVTSIQAARELRD